MLLQFCFGSKHSGKGNGLRSILQAHSPWYLVHNRNSGVQVLLRWFESAKGKAGGFHPLEFTLFCTSGLFRKLLPHAGRAEQVKDSSQHFPSEEFLFSLQ